MINDYELESMRKRVLLALYEVLSRCLPGVTEKKHESPHTVTIRRWHLLPKPGFSAKISPCIQIRYLLHGLIISYRKVTPFELRI